MEMVRYFQASIQSNNYSLQTTACTHTRPRPQYLQHDSSLHCDEIWQKISSGITAPHVPDHSDVLNSATWASLSLEGFWDILNARKWNKAF